MSKINVWLYDNQLTADPNDYFGRVQSQGKITNNEIADAILEEGIELNKNTIIDILNRSDKMKIKLLTQGYSINTGVFHSHIGIQGVFKGVSDHFNSDEHSVVASFVSSSDLRKELKLTEVEILGKALTTPVISKVIDNLTKNEDSIITPNNVIEIRGSRLKIEGDDAVVGVYFINQNTDERTEATQIVNNESKKLLVMLPDLASGNYQLEIGTQFSNGKSFLKTPLVSQFEHILIVE